MLLTLALWTTAAISAHAQDAVKADPKHYTVEFENDQVRVLRVKYAPGEKSVMHRHPANVAVFLTDGNGKFTLPDGKSEEVPFKAGSTMWGSGETHLPENVGGQPFELILVELKGGKGAE
jgi:quercetin dioxygenase-like cupin family protein